MCHRFEKGDGHRAGGDRQHENVHRVQVPGRLALVAGKMDPLGDAQARGEGLQLRPQRAVAHQEEPDPWVPSPGQGLQEVVEALPGGESHEAADDHRVAPDP